MRVRWTTPAKEQFVSVYEYIGGENRSEAAKIADQIWESTQLLGKHPLAGRPGRIEGTRELVIQGAPFIVAYRVEKNEVWVLSVMHAARMWPDEF